EAGMAQDAGKLVLRVADGGLVLLHGSAQIINGPSHILGMMARLGMPEVFGYAVYIGEVLAPSLVIIGLLTIPAALIIVVNLIFAIVMAHGDQLFTLTKSGGWALELQGMFLFGALAIALLGAGRYSAGGSYGKWN